MSLLPVLNTLEKYPVNTKEKKKRIDESTQYIGYKWKGSDTIHTYKHYETIETYGKRVQTLYSIEEGIIAIIA